MLTRESRIRLLADLDKFNDAEDQDLNWVATQSGREATRQIKAAFPVASKQFNPFGVASAEADNALTKLYERVIALPVGQRTTSVISIAKEIIAESNNNKNLTPALAVPATIQEIVDKYKPGPQRDKMLKAWEAKYFMSADPEDFKRVTQNDIMSLAKELGVIV
jgi:hypothetical protein